MVLAHWVGETDCGSRVGKLKGNKGGWNRAYSDSFLSFSGWVAWPGLGPAGEVLSFASPKESTRRKGEPKSGPLRGSLRCSRRGGNSQTCPLRGLRTCEFLIPTPLRCSARPHGKRRKRDRERTPPRASRTFTPSPLWEEGWG